MYKFLLHPLLGDDELNGFFLAMAALTAIHDECDEGLTHLE
jgi:hypothetical protein